MKNKKHINLYNGTMLLQLTQNKWAVIDEQDWEKVKDHTWHTEIARKTFYATTSINGRSVRMHRLIMDPGKGEIVDHRDGNGLNNRRSNLRVCNNSQNLRNRGLPASNKTGFKGVYKPKDRKKYTAQIKTDSKSLYLGSFSDPVDAAKAYDAAARAIFGEFAMTNKKLGLY